MREFPAGVDLLIFKAVVVEAHSLDVHDEVVGRLGHVGRLGNVGFFVAEIALVVGDDLALDVFLE